MKSKDNNKYLLLIDCDGVLTPKKTYYSSEGKLFKIFDSDDSYAIKHFKNSNYEIVIITADSYGFPITEARARDWKVKVILSSNKKQSVIDLLGTNKYQHSVFVGNGPEDSELVEFVDYFYAPKDARPEIINHPKNNRITVLDVIGGDGVVWNVYQHLHRK